MVAEVHRLVDLAHRQRQVGHVREIASGLTGSFDPVIQNKNR
ncbi:hypothetical protein [Rhizobacter sp. P5_C2]